VKWNEARPGQAGLAVSGRANPACVLARSPLLPWAKKKVRSKGIASLEIAMPYGSRSNSPRRPRYVAKDMPVTRVEEMAFRGNRAISTRRT